MQYFEVCKATCGCMEEDVRCFRVNEHRYSATGRWSRHSISCVSVGGEVDHVGQNSNFVGVDSLTPIELPRLFSSVLGPPSSTQAMHVCASFRVHLPHHVHAMLCLRHIFGALQGTSGRRQKINASVYRQVDIRYSWGVLPQKKPH